jgi:pimeloyl-ACP methyl ester carboxylesterase
MVHWEGDAMPTEREIRFSNGPTRLAGTLWLPEGNGLHPSIVMIQGSGASDRESGGYFTPIRQHLVREGVAVLGYDKPGCGASSGDWRDQTFRDRAAEALAALRMLREYDGIDARRTGLYGHSQGGWVVPLAASLSSDVAFIITTSGPAVSPALQDAYAVEAGLRADGWQDTAVTEAHILVDRLADAARAAVAVESILPLVKQASAQPWFQDLLKCTPLPDPSGLTDPAPLWGFVRRRDPITDLPLLDYDPVPALEHLRCPMLAAFGELDRSTPVGASVAAIEAVRTRDTSKDITVTVFPGANHRLRVAPSNEFVPGFLDTVGAWVRLR